MKHPDYYFVTSPHKVILFGEHSVVYGGRAISTAINLQSLTFFSERISLQSSAYIESAKRLVSFSKGQVNIISPVNQGRGLGSSAVTVASTLKLLSNMKGNILAEKSFNIERDVQGVGSPIDTSSIIFGGTIAVNEGSEMPFFKTSFANTSWEFSRIRCEPLDLIIVDCGERPKTAEIVLRVKAAFEKNPSTIEILKRIDYITREAKKYLVQNDRYELGRLMNENHEQLRKLGLSTSTIEKVKKIGDKLALGAKITGAGLGGFVIILYEKNKQREIIKEISRLELGYYVVKSNAHPMTRHSLVP